MLCRRAFSCIRLAVETDIQLAKHRLVIFRFLIEIAVVVYIFADLSEIEMQYAAFPLGAELEQLGPVSIHAGKKRSQPAPRGDFGGIDLPGGVGHRNRINSNRLWAENNAEGI